MSDPVRRSDHDSGLHPTTPPPSEDNLNEVANGESGTASVLQQPRPSLYQRFKQAVKRLKREVLALYYAMQDPRTGVLPRLLVFLVLSYALSPFDLIPDFIPILGLVDDLLLLPGMIWLAVWLIPAAAMEAGRARAESEPLRLASNWGAAAFIFALWDALLLWLVYWACARFGSEAVQARQWWVVGGCAAVLVVAEVGWSVWQIRRERRRVAGKEEAAEGLEEGLLQGQH